MAKNNKQRKFNWKAHKPLLAAALAVAGVFHMVGAVIAEGTEAGTAITNTATATYDDGSGGPPINATSNTVTINVAEVAGITAVPSGFDDVNGGAIEGTDTLVYEFTVTNVGNEESDVSIPAIADIGSQNFDITTVEIVDIADGTTVLGTVPAGGDNFSTIIGANDPFGTGNQNVPADGQFIVRVTGTIATGTVAGDPVGVTLGDTGPNDNTAATQNQPLTAGTGDLTTIDVDPTVAPVNGTREASATDSRPFASNNAPLALATVLKTSSLTSNNGTPAVPTDDEITYDLGMRVESVVPAGNVFQAAPLEGTALASLDGAAATRILISDAIPEGTALTGVNTSLPTGWTPVYSLVAPAGTDPLGVAWTTVAPTDLSTVERVGFIHNGPLAPGYATTGLTFTVDTRDLPAAGGDIDNIAQVFGETVGDPTDEVVYDESGDQNPNNFDGNTPPDATGSNYPAGGDDGVADEPNDGIDTVGDNTGNGPDGEINRITIIPPNDDILNGPDGTPGAVGPNNDNDDFTNLSTGVAPGLEEGDTLTPNAVTFTNSVTNPAAGGFLSNVTLEPVAPSVADTATGTTGQYGTNADIDDGTVVTISYPGLTDAVYTYNGTTEEFELTSGAPINVGNIIPGQTEDYDVTVQLPGTATVLDAVSIPIIAFPDDDPSPAGTPGFNNETTNNVTINRVYTGFMRLVKEARVLAADGTERLPFTPNFAATDNIAPGEFIEYRITYTNISEAATGANNVTLTASNFVLTENGTTGGNTWAANTTHQQNTANSNGSMVFTDVTGPTSVTADPVDGTKVDIYENTVATVAPQDNGTLEFRRVVD